MRSLLLASFLAIISSTGHAAPAQERAGKGRTNMFRGAYDPPKDLKHQTYYERLQKGRLLERFSEGLSSIRLPKPLVIKFASCDGTSNAWYEPSDGTVTFCYEYVDDLWHGSEGAAARGVAVDVAWEGAVIFVLLHETGHALFDLLKVPILGREEDAADNVAAFLLLRAGEGAARRVLTGAAWMYLHDSKGRMPDESDFADVHGLDSQRFYNVLCMAHGSNPASFKGMVEKGYLPKERAEGCTDEFRQVGYAVKQLIDPSIDVALAARIRAAHKARWEGAKKVSEAAAESQQK
jgi:Putative metallopeptidase